MQRGEEGFNEVSVIRITITYIYWLFLTSLTELQAGFGFCWEPQVGTQVGNESTFTDSRQWVNASSLQQNTSPFVAFLRNN